MTTEQVKTTDNRPPQSEEKDNLSMSPLLKEIKAKSFELASLVEKAQKFKNVKQAVEKIENCINYAQLTFQKNLKFEETITAQRVQLAQRYDNALKSAKKQAEDEVKPIKI